MNLISTAWKTYVDWLESNLPQYAQFNGPASGEKLRALEDFVGEKMPEYFISLYSLADGGKSESILGPFLGFNFLSIDEILEYLKEIQTHLKRPHRFIPEEVRSQSDSLILAIVHSLRENTTIPDWERIEFSISTGSTSCPVVFDVNSKRHLDNPMFENEKLMKLWQTHIKALFSLEKDTYNWDQLQFIISRDSYQVERLDYFSQEDFSSYPPSHIRRLEFQLQWIPIFSDSAGNYIGLDLNPDVLGIKGQVINFGRDEFDRFVIATSLESFLELILVQLQQGELDKAIQLEDDGEYSYGLRPHSHLIDDLRNLVVQ